MRTFHPFVLTRRVLPAMLAALLVACTHAQPDDANLVAFSTQLRGDQEVPPATSMGRGQLDAVLDKNTGQLRWKVSHSGLTGPVTAAHFHSPAMPGANAPVVLPLASPLPERAEGSAMLSPAQSADLLAGRWYVNLHTAAFPGGEVRGQLTPR